MIFHENKNGNTKLCLTFLENNLFRPGFPSENAWEPDGLPENFL